MSASVYIARAAGRGIKVGYSANPADRLRQVAAEIGEPVTLLSATPKMDNAEAVEAMAHWILRDSHAGAEWFAVEPNDAQQSVAEAVSRVARGEEAPRRINNATPFAKLKEARIQLVITQAELDAIDDWRAENQVWSRSEAIRQLVTAGLTEIKRRTRKTKGDAE